MLSFDVWSNFLRIFLVRVVLFFFFFFFFFSSSVVSIIRERERVGTDLSCRARVCRPIKISFYSLLMFGQTFFAFFSFASFSSSSSSFFSLLLILLLVLLL